LKPVGCIDKFSKTSLVEKWTFNCLATALVDMVAVSMPIAHSLKIWGIYGIMLCDTTAHFSGLLLSWHQVHLCNDQSCGLKSHELSLTQVTNLMTWSLNSTLTWDWWLICTYSYSFRYTCVFIK
jgi:hypothetical protein